MTAMLAPVLTLRSSGRRTLTQQALAILAKYGSAANLYLPGAGAINGITAGNWLDSAGTTAATVDNPVGLVISAGKAVGVNVFSDAAVGIQGESTRVSPGVYRVYSSTGAFTSVFVGGSILLPNKTYRLRFNVDSIKSGALAIDGPIGSVLPAVSAGVGQKEVVVTMTATTSIGIKRSASVTDIQISNLRIEELPGAHLTQSTAANQPILRRGLVNYMMQSQFATGWAVVGSDIIAQNKPSPTGQNNAVKLVMSAVTGRHGIYRATSAPETTGAVLSVSVFAKADGLSKLSISNGGIVSFHAVFDLANQTHGNRPGQTLQVTTSMQSVGNGWFRCGFTYTATGNNAIALSFSGYSTQPLDNYGVSGGAGNGVDGILLFGAQVERSSSIGEYVATTTAPASSATGPFAWQFDGSNDSFASTMTTGNEGWVCAGTNVQALNPAGAMFVGNGAFSATGSPGMMIYSHGAGGGGFMQLWLSNGVSRQFVGSTVTPTGSAFVFDGGWDASSAAIAINGVEQNLVKTIDPTSAQTIRIGIDPGLFWMLNGLIFATIIMPTVLPTASERTTLRQFIASLSGVTM